MSRSLLEVLRNVTLDPGEHAAFSADPAGYLAQYGYEDVPPEDLAEAFSLVADTLPPDVAQTVSAELGAEVPDLDGGFGAEGGGQLVNDGFAAGPSLDADPTETTFGAVNGDFDEDAHAELSADLDAEDGGSATDAGGGLDDVDELADADEPGRGFGFGEGSEPVGADDFGLDDLGEGSIGEAAEGLGAEDGGLDLGDADDLGLEVQDATADFGAGTDDATDGVDDVDDGDFDVQDGLDFGSSGDIDIDDIGAF